MLKEIAEQPQAVADTLLGRLGRHGELVLDEVRLSDQELRDVDKIFVVACGTAYHAGLIAKYAIEHWTRIPVEVEVASEFRYRDPVLDRSTLVIVISQSGETMDTLMALRHAREQNARVLAICNANGSTIPRESDAVLYTHAGPEVAVASTKGFLTQLVACYLVGLFLAQVRGMKYEDEVAAIVADLRRLPEAVAEVLAGMEPVRELARSLADQETILFLGRHVGFPVALEGALKLKELAYIHAEGFAAGELKHGPIAVIDQGTPVVVVVPSPRGRESLHGKVVSNIQEVRARGARTIVIAEDGDEAVVPYADHVIRVPRTPDAAGAGRDDGAAAGARLRDRRHPRPRRRPAAQPRQVRHRRVTRARRWPRCCWRRPSWGCRWQAAAASPTSRPARRCPRAPRCPRCPRATRGPRCRRRRRATTVPSRAGTVGTADWAGDHRGRDRRRAGRALRGVADPHAGPARPAVHRGRAVHAVGQPAHRGVARRPVRGQGGARQGARGAG